jgi:hypothetical protein
MADAVMQVDRLDGVPGEEVDGIQRLGEAQQVPVVVAVADPPATVEVGDVRWAPDGPERDPVGTELDVVLFVPGMERERRGRRADPLGDHGRVETDALAAVFRLGTRRTQDLAGLYVEEVHPDLGEHAERRVMDRLELVGRQDLDRPVPEPRLGPRPLLGQRAPCVRLTATRPAPTQALSRGGIHVSQRRLQSTVRRRCERRPRGFRC